jgi:hypothetical protein
MSLWERVHQLREDMPAIELSTDSQASADETGDSAYLDTPLVTVGLRTRWTAISVQDRKFYGLSKGLGCHATGRRLGRSYDGSVLANRAAAAWSSRTVFASYSSGTFSRRRSEATHL